MFVVPSGVRVGSSATTLAAGRAPEYCCRLDHGSPRGHGLGPQRNVLRREGRRRERGEEPARPKTVPDDPPDEHDCDRSADQQPPRAPSAAPKPLRCIGRHEAHPVNLGFRLPLVFGAVVTKFVALTSLTTLAFDVGWSKALPAGTIPAM